MGKGGKAQTVGYKYHLGMHIGLCHGPIDAITRLRVDERDAWTGYSAGGTINVNAPELFGGEKREGGVSGNVDVMMGGPAQGKNAYLASKLGELIPAYRGIVSLVFRGSGAIVGGVFGAILGATRSFYFGNNPYLKAWSVRGQRVSTRDDGQLQWYPSRAPILNPASITPGSAVGFNQFAKNFGVTPSTTYSPGRGGVLRISKPRAADSGGKLTWDAWSAWDNDAGVGGGNSPVPGQTWDNRFEVWASNGGAFTRIFQANEAGLDTNLYATPDDAFNAINALLPLTFTGWDTYRVQAQYDNNPSDNRGGISLLIEQGVGVIDLNAAHIIRECLTNSEWGMGYTDDDVDEDYFMSAANTFQAEGLGLSLLWDKTKKIEDFVSMVQEHVDAALYVSRRTGKFILKPIRGGYDEATLLHLNEGNIVEVSDPTRVTFGELTNSVTVTYWDAINGKDASLTVTDTALVQQQGVVINAPLQYPGFSNPRNATIAAQRDLRALSSPLLSCTITADEEAKDLEIGDVFKFSWKKWGLVEVVMRVNGISYGTGRNNRVKIQCTQDVFDTDTALTIVVENNEWTNPSAPPEVPAHELATEAPYWELVQVLGQSTVDTKLQAAHEIGYVIAAASQPASAINASLYTDDGTGYEDVGAFDFAAYATLEAAIDKTQTSFVLSGGAGLSDVTLGTHFQLGEELLRFDALDFDTGEITVGRGVLDTVPQEHEAGAVALFWDQDAGFDPTEYVAGEEVNVKVIPVSGAGVLPFDAAEELTVELDSRAWRPYAPGDLRVNGESYTPNAVYTGELTISWAHRDRIQQTGGVLIDAMAGNIGPEVGTTYRLQGYVDDVLVHTEDDIDGTETTWTPSMAGVIKVEVHAKRDDVYSWQAPWHVFRNQTSGSIGTEDNFDRVTEDGDERYSEN